MNFGAVLPKLLVSVGASLALASSHANAETLFSTYKAYEEKVGECLNLSRDKKVALPHNSWLPTLTEQQQREVIVYLSRQAIFRCQQPSQKIFINRLSLENEDVQNVINDILYIVEEPVFEGNVDKEKLSQLTSQTNRPFDIFQAFDALGIEPREVQSPERPQ